VPAIEKAGTLNSDKVVEVMRDQVVTTAGGVIKYAKDEQGRYLHELTWGPGYLTAIGVQWQDGKMAGVWPNKWKPTPESKEITYKGMVDYKIPPGSSRHIKNSIPLQFRREPHGRPRGFCRTGGHAGLCDEVLCYLTL
jgi:branched-chain amino acid transport system substrate-binding protein